jgi:uncharacterized protein (TIGR03083 family)
MTDSPVATYASAARAFAHLVHELPAPDWAGPGLGEWDLRALVGHTSRSLITVSTYLQTTAEREDATSAADYYVKIRDYAATLDAADIVARGRQAGRDLGSDPAATIDGLVDRALADLDGVGDPLITVIGGMGIRLSHYLSTRTFELAVHGLDIARACGIAPVVPADVLADATMLAARIGVALGQGESMLLALTGRSSLPDSFSVV